MDHFEKFINEIQTLKITIEDRVFYYDGTFADHGKDNDQIIEMIRNNPNQLTTQMIKGIYPVYCLSHYNQNKSDYEYNLSVLQQDAINSILDKSPDQINRHIRRLHQIEDRLKKILDHTFKFYNGEMDFWEFKTNDLEGKFICQLPKNEGDQPKWIETEIWNLHDAIIFKQGYLSGFIFQVKKVLDPKNKPKQEKQTQYKTLKELFEEKNSGEELIDIKNNLFKKGLLTEDKSIWIGKGEHGKIQLASLIKYIGHKYLNTTLKEKHVIFLSEKDFNNKVSEGTVKASKADLAEYYFN